MSIDLLVEAERRERSAKSRGDYFGVVGLVDGFLTLSPEQEHIPRALNLRGIAFRMTGLHEAAFESYKQALELLLDGRDPAMLAETYVNIADVHRTAPTESELSSLDEAARSLDLARTHATPGAIEEALIEKQYGLIRFARGDTEAAMASFRSAADTAKALPETKARRVAAQALQPLASTALQRNEYELAREATIEALGEFEQLEDNRGLYNTLATLGRIHEAEGDPERAITDYQRARLHLEGDDRALGHLALLESIARHEMGEHDAGRQLGRYFLDRLGAMNEADLHPERETLKRFADIYTELPLPRQLRQL